MVKVWTITPKSENIVVTDVRQDVIHEAKRMFGWTEAEIHSYTHENGNKYLLLVNENGMEEDKVYNPCATRYLLTINLYWGTDTLNGDHMIVRMRKEHNHWVAADMDITHAEFARGFNRAIARENNKIKELMMGDNVVQVTF